MRSDDDIRKKQARRKKRADAKAVMGKGEKVNDDLDNGDSEKVELADLFTPYLIVRATGKIKSFALPEETRTKSATQVRYHSSIPRLVSYVRLPQIFFALSNNALEVFNVPKYTKSKESPPESARLYSLDLPGHRTDVRTLALSSDDTLLASASNGKWHQLTVEALQTVVKVHSKSGIRKQRLAFARWNADILYAVSFSPVINTCVLYRRLACWLSQWCAGCHRYKIRRNADF